MMIRRATTVATVALSMLSVSRSAVAQESREVKTAESDKTVMNTVMFGGFGLGAVGLGLSFLFQAQANSLYEERRDIARGNGSEAYTAWRCSGADECNRMRGLREDQDAARTRWAASLGVAVGGLTLGTAVLVARLIDSSHVADSGGGERKSVTWTPTVSPQAAGFQLQGTF